MLNMVLKLGNTTNVQSGILACVFYEYNRFKISVIAYDVRATYKHSHGFGCSAKSYRVTRRDCDMQLRVLPHN